MSGVEEKVVKMNVEEVRYLEADSTNLPKVDTCMLFDFLKNGRKFSYAGFQNDKENLNFSEVKKYGDDSIGYVCLVRNPAYCVVKASITDDDDGSDNSCFAIRALICEAKNAIRKIECRKCVPIECIHGFALLMWLHRRTEESTEQIVNYYKKPGSVFSRTPKPDMTEDHLLTPTSSPIATVQFSRTKQDMTKDHLFSPKSSPTATITTSCLNNHYYSPDTKLFLHGNRISGQTSTNSSQRSSQTLFCTSQQTSEETSQKSQNSGSALSQISNSEIDHTYSSRLSRTANRATHVSENASPKSTCGSKYSPIVNYEIANREYCESEITESARGLSQKVAPLSQITNTEHIISPPRQFKNARKAPYSQKPVNANSPMTTKKQSVLSKKVSQLVKQPKIENFFTRPKPELEDSKPQIKNLFMGELVKKFLKLNEGTVVDFMRFARKQMTEFLCQEAEKLTRVQRTDLWMDLRYGRITASIINEAAYCRTINGSLVNKILGKVGRYKSPAMKRGIDLEDSILQQVQIQENITTSSSGLFLMPSCPIIGASPDAIGSDFIVEIKAPSSERTFETFLPNGTISKKCKSQMYLQMYCTGMKRGIFCVADPNFERNKKVTTVWLDYDEEFNEILEKAKTFWISVIFPQLVNSF